jgi:putative DNA primase/helicase
MTKPTVDSLSRVIAAFNAKPTSDKEWRGTCPLCQHNCLLISKGDKQPVAAWCSKGCDKKEVNAAVYKAAGVESKRTFAPFTVERFCELKKLPLHWVTNNFLVHDGIYENRATNKCSKTRSLCFPYLGETTVTRTGTRETFERHLGGVKFRFSEDSHKTAWMDYEKERAIPYGLWTLPILFEANGIDTSIITLVEGESDTITLAYSGIPALGISGAPHGWKDRFAKLPALEKAKRILVVQEPGDAGQKFVQKVAASFPAGKVWVVQLPAKDPSELWVKSATAEQFVTAWDKAVAEATVVGPAPESGEYTVEKLSSIVPKPLTWLWPGRIPKGKLTVFAGNPGVGKGLATCSLAAIATTGGMFPDEPICDRDPIEVLMMFCEDDAEDTVVPRLMAAGADLTRISRIKANVVGADSTKSERELAFDTDLKILKHFLAANPSVKLVIVDPVSSYLGRTKPNDEQEVRRVLVPLADLANETGVTFVLVAHFNKRSDVSALHKILGAVAMTGVARAAWMFTADDDDEDSERYLMLQGKLNVGKKQKGLEYTIGSKQVLPEPAESTGMIVWGNATDVTADKALGSIGAFKDESGNKVKVTGGWLRNLIGTEGHLATEIFEAAKAAGISEKTLRRAKTELGVVSEKSAGGWFWRMPRETTEADAELATLM